MPNWLSFLDRITGGDGGLDLIPATHIRLLALRINLTSTRCFLSTAPAPTASPPFSTRLPLSWRLSPHGADRDLHGLQHDRHPTELASLRGAAGHRNGDRGGRRWAESKIKALTGGDKIAARFMRQDFFEFTPQFKLMIAGNHKPGLRSVDEAIRRRLDLIPFTVTIPPRNATPVSPISSRPNCPASWPG